MVADEEYKGISPSIHRNYQDNESGKVFNVMLKGAALTNVPFLKDMQTVELSELSEDKQKAIRMLKHALKFDNKEIRKQAVVSLRNFGVDVNNE